jgi:hypothetical protein
LTQKAQNTDFAVGLNALTLPPIVWNAVKCIELGPEYDLRMAMKRKPKNCDEIEGNMRREKYPEKHARHVLYVDPNQIAVTVIGLKLTVFTNEC